MNIGDDDDDDTTIAATVSARNTAVFSEAVTVTPESSHSGVKKPNDYVELSFLACCLNMLCGLIALSFSGNKSFCRILWKAQCYIKVLIIALWCGHFNIKKYIFHLH